MFKQFFALFILLIAAQAVEAQGYNTVPMDNAPAYDQFVVTAPVAAMYVNGVLRFCPRENLRGRICGQEGRMFGMFGKKQFMPMDWFNPESYVTAVTGRPSVTVTSIGPTADGEGLVIYFR